MKNNNSKLNAVELVLMSLLFAATAPEEKQFSCCNSDDFQIPSQDGEWKEIYQSLRDRNILDDNFNLTKYGLSRAHKACSEGVNFERMAERNPNVAVAMLNAAVTAIKIHDENGYNFSERANELFATLSADLAYLSLPAEETIGA